MTSTSPPTGTSTSASATPVSGELSITWESGSKPAMTAVVAEFQKKYPGTTVNVDYLAPDALATQIPTRLAAGTGPDIFRADAGSGTAVSVVGLAKRGFLAPLTGSWTSQMPPSISPVLKKDDQFYGFSISLTNVAQLLNDKLMKDNGLTAPTTFSEVLAFCKAARAKGTVAYAAGPATPFEARSVIYAMSYQTVYSKTPDFDAKLADGSLTWQTSGWVDAIQRNIDMVNAGCFPDNFTGTDLPGAFNLLFGGKVLGIVGYGAYLPYGPKEVTFSTYPLPATDTAADSGMIVAPFQSMVVNAKAKNPALAQAFVDFLATPEIDQLYVANQAGNGGLVPTFADEANPSPLQVNQQITAFLKSGKSNTFPDATFPSAEVTAALESHMQQALALKESAQQVAEAVQAAYDRAPKS